MHRARSALATRQLQRSYGCTRRFSTAAVLQSSAQFPRLKVGILPFLEGVEESTEKEVLQEAGAAIYQKEASSASLLDKLSAFFTNTISKNVGIGGCTKLESYRKVYLPYYLVDAIIIVHTTSAIGNARMYVHFDQFPAPAHNEADLQLLTVEAPPATNVKYEALDIKRHLQAKGVDWHPFLFSPTTMATSLIRHRDLFKSVPLLALSSTARESQTIAASKSIKKGEQQEESEDRLRLHRDIMSVEYLSFSPVLLPYYIAKYTNSSSSLSDHKRNMTLAYPSWKSTGGSPLLINTHFGHSEKASSDEKPTLQEWTVDGIKERRNIRLFFSPRIPIASRLQEEADRANQAAREAEDKMEEIVQAELRQKNIERTFKNMQKVRETYKQIGKQQRSDASKRMAVVQEEESRRDAVEVTFVESILQQRVQEAMEQALGDDLAASQRLIEERRQIQTGGEIAPEKMAGLGSSINWNSPLVTAPSGCDGKPSFEENQTYYDAYAAWKSMETHVNLYERIAEEDRPLLYGDRDKPKDKSGRELIATAHKKMIDSRPAWVPKWRGTLPKKIVKSAAEMAQLGRQKSKSTGEEDEQSQVGNVIKPGKSQRLLEQEAQEKLRQKQAKADAERKVQEAMRQKEERKERVLTMRTELEQLKKIYVKLQEKAVRESGSGFKAKGMHKMLRKAEQACKKKQDEIKAEERG